MIRSLSKIPKSFSLFKKLKIHSFCQAYEMAPEQNSIVNNSEQSYIDNNEAKNANLFEQYYNQMSFNKDLQLSGVTNEEIQENDTKPEAESTYELFRGFYNPAMSNLNLPGITIVRDKKSAEIALEVQYKFRNRVHSWDTEVIDIEIKKQSPIGHGNVLSAQCFAGPDVNFGNGPRLFIDNFGDASDVLMLFKEYFEDQSIKKSWFNYGFDRHVLNNMNINCKGFGGDAMHMGRLADPSKGPKSYSLSALTFSYEKEIHEIKTRIQEQLKNSGNLSNEEMSSMKIYEEHLMNQSIKQNITKLFMRKRILKSGEEGKTWEVPSLIELHTSEKTVVDWVNYCTLDAELTFFLRETLIRDLTQLKIDFEGMGDLHQLYNRYWLDFGEVLTDMERKGFLVDVDHQHQAELQALKDIEAYEKEFKDWVVSIQPGTEEFNPSSTQQLQQLLYAPFHRKKRTLTAAQKKEADRKENEGSFDGINDENEELLAKAKEFEEPSLTTPKSLRNIDTWNYFDKLRGFRVDNTINELKDGKDKPLKYRTMIIEGLGVTAPVFTASGLPSVDVHALKILAGSPSEGNYGKAYDHFKKLDKEEFGKKLCHALEKLVEHRQNETLVQTYLKPLQELVDKDNRIHCSQNLNTETGRLSARRPNLQNQPAQDKDKYKIRKAFKAGENQSLIVADYGQLELRIQAHMTNCKAMIDAFEKGGDFHSRTAQSMFDYIQKDIEEGEILLEWDYGLGAKPPKPLLKEKYASERKKAKVMNFSIAYGKTSGGFAKDWNCTYEEAEKTQQAWFKERQEVKAWQDRIKRTAVEKGWTQTMLGRYRNLTKHFKKGVKREILHGLRAAINTPIQGGAADIVIAAMVLIWKNQRLKNLGWEMIQQIHDEIVLEGPKATEQEALSIVMKCMEEPLMENLRIKLEVDAKICDNWYEAK